MSAANFLAAPRLGLMLLASAAACWCGSRQLDAQTINRAPAPMVPAATASPPPMKLGVTFTARSLLGALVMDVHPGSPAAKAGLQAGDRILEANGHTISGAADAVQLVNGLSSGSALHMLIARQGRRQVLETTLTPWKAPAAIGTVAAPVAPVYAPFPLGFPFQLTPADIDDQHAYGG